MIKLTDVTEDQATSYVVDFLPTLGSSPEIQYLQLPIDEIPGQYMLILNYDTSVIVPEGSTLNLNGGIALEGGTIENNGSIEQAVERIREAFDEITDPERTQSEPAWQA